MHNFVKSTIYLTSICSLSLLYGCGSSSNSNQTETGTENGEISAGSVEAALADFPNSLLPRFALNNSDVTAGEIYRRIDFTQNNAGEIFWGVEGASGDESLELEVVYATDNTVVENIRNDILDELPTNIESAILATYPDAIIDEIERSTSDQGEIAFAVLFDTAGEELEGNYDTEGTFLFLEDVQERSDFPASILASIDALNAPVDSLPEAEYQLTTFADGTLTYAVEFESDTQSITVNLNSIGDVLTIEHEDLLEDLSTSDSVDDALEDFPEGIGAEFAANFSEVPAAEIFRRVVLNSTGENTTVYGIEGVSDDESIEVEAVYTSDIVLVEQARGEIIDELPVNVETAFSSLYPSVEIDEIAEVVTPEGTTYSIVFIQEDEELEANFNAAGEFLTLEEALDEAAIPLSLLETIGAERVLLPIVEFELVTFANGEVGYVVEYENETQSISYQLDANGIIEQVEHESAI